MVNGLRQSLKFLRISATVEPLSCSKVCTQGSEAFRTHRGKKEPMNFLWMYAAKRFHSTQAADG